MYAPNHEGKFLIMWNLFTYMAKNKFLSSPYNTKEGQNKS